jgi:hypothetical protein
MSAGSPGLVAILLRVGRAWIVRVAAAGTTAVELDAVTGAGNTVAFAGAGAGVAGDAGWAGGVGGAGAGEGWDIGVVVGVGVRVRVVVDVGMTEAGGQLVDGGLSVVSTDEVGGLDWVVWLWALDLAWGDTTATGNLLGHAAWGALGGLGSAGRAAGGLGGWDVEDVELAASGWLDDGLVGWIMGDVVSVHDVVVPVSLTLLHGATLEAEGTVPWSGLGGNLGKRKLSLVVVPGAEQMNGLAASGGAESEVKLDSGHFVD